MSRWSGNVCTPSSNLESLKLVRLRAVLMCSVR